jgi:PAS domain S-box-containing protein
MTTPLTILVVEDNNITRKVMRVALAYEGYRVLEAEDGRTALEQVRRERPALILMDLVLPDIHGLELLALIRALPGVDQLPIIACTGFLPQDDRPGTNAPNFTAVLIKPVEPSRLVSTVNAYLRVPRSSARLGTGRRILVANDDEVQLKLTRIQLEGFGFVVDSARDGSAALELARRNPPDAILADVLMPRLDGFKLCLEIRKDRRLGAIPVVLQSGKFIEEADRLLAKKVGANAYLTREPDSGAAVDALLASLKAAAVPSFDEVRGGGADYLRRMVDQLERQTRLNAGLVQSYSQLASALSVLGATSDALAGNEEVGDALHEVLDRCIDAAGISVGILYCAEPTGGFRIHAATGYRISTGSIAEGFFGHPELLVRAHASRAALRIPSSDVDDETASDFLGRFGLTHALISPVAFRDEPLGAILFGTNTREIGGEDWLGFARVVSSQLGQAMALNRTFQQLRESEEQYRSLFECTPLSAWVYDLETRQILSVNESAVRNYGYTRAELLSLRTDDLESRRVVPVSATDATASNESGAIGWHRRKDGSEIAVEVFSNGVLSRGRTVQLVVANDISERLRTQAALEDRERLFSQIADNIKEVFFVCDVRFLEMVYVSPAYEHIWGRSCRSLYENPASFMGPVVPKDRPALVAYIAELQRGCIPGEIEYSLLHTNGELRQVLMRSVPVRNERGEVYRISGVALDITARKRAEDALRLSEERFRALVEHSGDAIALLDAAGTITYASASSERVFGFDVSELVGRDVIDLLHPDDAVNVRTQLATLGGGPDEVTTLGARFQKRDGSWRRGEGTLRNRLGDVAVRALVLNFRDVSDQHLLEQQFRQSQKMEAVGQLAGGVAHDFNNLLTAITGFAELMRYDLPVRESQQESLDEITYAAKRAAALTRQLLAFSRQQVLQPRVIDVNGIVVGVNKMLQRIIGDEVTLKVALSTTAGDVLVDPGQLEQVILNLCLNARDAMPKGGLITLATMNVEFDDADLPRRGPVVAGEYVLLSVTDTGTGMTEDVKRHLFEPFFTTKPQGKGTGLGLATVYGIITHSGGHVWVESEIGNGSTFNVCLPRVRDAMTSVPMDVVPSDIRGGTEAILLVEDDDGVRQLTKTVLQRAGYHVAEASGAHSAMREIESHPGSFALLITDVVMPGLSGPEIAKFLRSRDADLRTLFMSGYSDDTVLRHGVLAPDVSCLQKPFTPRSLLTKVREVLDAASRH